MNALVILCHLGLAQPCQLDPSEQMINQCQKINLYLLHQASFQSNYQVLACATTGIGIPTNHFTQLFYRAYFVDGLKTAKQFANYVYAVLIDLNWLVLDKEGLAVQDKAKSIQIIQAQAESFLDSDKIEIAKQLKLFA